MKRLVILAAALLAVFGLAGAATADDAPALSIVRVGYNATGADTTANSWQEYIDIHNGTDKAVNVEGWATQDQWAHNTYGKDAEASQCNTAVFAKATDVADATRFHHLPAHDPDDAESPVGLWLPKGDSIRVYTGGNVDSVNNSWHTIALNKSGCGYHGHYINNGGDTLYLLNKAGNEVTSFSFAFDNGYFIR